MKLFTYITLISACAIVSACSYNVENKSIVEDVNGSKVVSVLPYKIEIQNPENFDQKVMVLGIMCRAHKYTPAISKDIARFSNPESSQEKTIIAKSANHTAKCMATSPFQGKCQAKININGTIVDANGKTTNFDINKEAVAASTACEGANRSIKQATTEAVKELISKL